MRRTPTSPQPTQEIATVQQDNKAERNDQKTPQNEACVLHI